MSGSKVKVGCCGFPLRKAQYAERFPVVEVQETFYQPPRLATLQRWREQMPPEFEFTVKAWQLITHFASSPTYKRLKAQLSELERRGCGGFQPQAIVHEAWLATRACAQALDARMVLFQCPASFAPTRQNVAHLRDFFLCINRGHLRLLWEPRGDWPEVLIEPLCRELHLIHVVDPFIRRSVTRDFFYYRLHGGENYQHRFSDLELRQLLAVLPPDKQAYVMFNNHGMLEDAERFRNLLEGRERELRQAA